MTIEQFNTIEAGLWFSISIALLLIWIFNRSNKSYGLITVVSSIAFIAFGVSDLIEAKTGAWWKPFWLLGLKACCIAVLIACYLRYRKLKAFSQAGKNA